MKETVGRRVYVGGVNAFCEGSIVSIATTFGNVKRIRLINGRKVLCSRG